MHGGHQTFDDAVLLVNNPRQRSQTIRRARRIRDNGILARVLLLVGAHDVHRCVGRGRCDDHLLRAALQMRLALIDRRKHACRFNDVVNTELTPRYLRRFFPRQATLVER